MPDLIRVHSTAAIAALTLITALPPAATAQDDARPRADDGVRIGGRSLSPEMFGEMMAGLKQTPGCLGTDAAQSQSGKYLIFAWFRDKKAAMAWHDGPAHQKMMATFGMKGNKEYEAMAGIADDVGPILVVASAVPPRPAAEGQPARDFQLGIELYAPLPGGIRFGGGSFAPEAFREAVQAKAKADAAK